MNEGADDDDDDEFDPPTWTRWLLLTSVVGAVGSWWFDGPAQFTDLCVAVAGLTVVYLLYLWGQHRDPPGGDGGGKDRKEGELDGKGGGMGYA
jgi:hypothetical protein